MNSKIKPKQIAVLMRIDESLIKQLEIVAKENSIPRSVLIRLILQQYADKKGKKIIKLIDN